jgi:hypothetical protein
MNCRDCLDLLDGLEPGAAIPDPCRRHAESCPACALALRIEATLRDAPAWAEAPHLSPGTKAGVLSGARVGRLFWRQAAALFEDALVTSLVILFVAAGVVFLAPSLVGSLVPEPARQTMSRFMQPLLGSLAEFFRSFGPLLHQPWGIALTTLAVLSVLMAAVLSVRVLGPTLRLR